MSSSANAFANPRKYTNALSGSKRIVTGCAERVEFLAPVVKFGVTRGLVGVLDDLLNGLDGFGPACGDGSSLHLFAVSGPVSVFESDQIHCVHNSIFGCMSSDPSEKNEPRIRGSNNEPRIRGLNNEPRIRGSMAYLSLGFEFLSAFLMFAGGGYGLDYLLSESGRPGAGLIVGLFLGFGVGIWHLIRRSNELQRLEERDAALRREQEQSEVISASTSSEDIHARLQRVQRGVDAVHRKLGAALDSIPDGEPPRSAGERADDLSDSEAPGSGSR